jgi:RNA polymerase sigma-70 factor (ECF subfamily)
MSEEILAVGRDSKERARPDLVDVFHTTYRRLVVQLFGVTGSYAEAEDLVQEAFVQAAAARGRFLRVDNHEAWLRRTAVNLHRNRWRKRRNFSRIEHRLTGPADPPEVEQHLVLIEALRALPQQQREVIALHYLADLPVDEVADALGCAVGTVKSRLSRARVALGLALAPSEGDCDA